MGGMAGPSPELAAVLDAIVGPLRRVLHDMDDDEVPVPLRKVAKAMGGKRLPPPLLRSLLVEIDRNEWFRSKALEEIDAAAHPGTAALLTRQPGWWIDLADRAVAAAGAPTHSEDAQRALIAKLEGALAEAKRRVQDLHAKNQALETETKALRGRVRSLEEEDANGAGYEEAAARLRAAETQLHRERQLRLEADARVSEVLRRRAARQRRSVSGDERSVGRGDPVAVARRLDLEIAALAAAARGGETPTPQGERAPGEEGLRLPAGVLPDSAEAITWLLGLGGQVTLIVDGYNAGFLLNGDGHDPGVVRRTLLDHVDRLDRLAMTAHRIVVVFDSDQVTTEAPGLDPGGIEVRFATETANADDDIVDLVAALSSPAVVITNDRDLRERVEAHGALALWASAFVEWVRAA